MEYPFLIPGHSLLQPYNFYEEDGFKLRGADLSERRRTHTLKYPIDCRGLLFVTINCTYKCEM